MAGVVVGSVAGLYGSNWRDRRQLAQEARQAQQHWWITCDSDECTRFVGFVRPDGRVGTHQKMDSFVLRDRDRPPVHQATLVTQPDGRVYLRGHTQDGVEVNERGIVSKRPAAV